jgi:hypothetical protein
MIFLPDMNSSAINKSPFKSIIYYTGAAQVFFGAISSIGLLNIPLQAIFLLILLCFFLLGIIHLFTLKRFLPSLQTSYQIGFTVLITLVGIIAVFLFYYFVLTNVQNKSLTFGLIFFPLPFFIILAFQFFISIPGKKYKLWYYPLDQQMPDLDLLDLSKVLVIQFEFYKAPNDRDITNFKAKAPYEMPFGQLFFIFINDYNERNPHSLIKVTDEKHQPYAWTFYKKTSKWKSPQYVDPDLSFRENLITNNDIIFCNRH